MRRAIPPLSQYAFTLWCSVKAQGQLYLARGEWSASTVLSPWEKSPGTQFIGGSAELV